MILELNIWSFLLLFGCLQSVIICFGLLIQKNNVHRRNYLLAVLLLIFAIIEFDHGLRLSNLYLQFPNLIYISDGLWFAIAPTLYYISKIYTSINYSFKWYEVFHLLPLLIMEFYYFPLLTAPAETKIGILESYKVIGEYGVVTKLIIAAMMIQILIYIILSFGRFKKYEARYRNEFSRNQLTQLIWLKNTFRFFLIYFLFEFTFSTVRNFAHIQNPILDNWSLVVWTFFIYSVGYVLLIKSDLLLPQLNTKTRKKDNEDLSNSNESLQLIIQIMERDKPYKKDDLTLGELAKMAHVSANKLSHILNRNYRKSYYDFVNSYRAKEVVQLINQGLHEEMSILGISQEAGFRSKASFYKFFKMETGMTPTEFIESLNAISS